MYAEDNDTMLPFVMSGVKPDFNSIWWGRKQLVEIQKFPKKMFVCSYNGRNQDKDGDPDWTPGLGQNGFYALNTSRSAYALNGELGRQVLQWPGEFTAANQATAQGFIKRMNDTSRSIMVLEWRYGTYIDNNGTRGLNSSQTRFGTAKNDIRDHFGNGNNFAMVDGHVETLPWGFNPTGLHLQGRKEQIKASSAIYKALWHPTL